MTTVWVVTWFRMTVSGPCDHHTAVHASWDTVARLPGAPPDYRREGDTSWNHDDEHGAWWVYSACERDVVR